MTADPKYLYLNDTHKELLSALFYGVQNKRGIILIIGEVGTGKTTILNALRNNFDKKTKAAFIFNTNISFKQLLDIAVSEIGLRMPNKNMKMSETLQCLNKYAIKNAKNGGKTILIIDEAQNLSKSALENLRLLSNLETRQTKLIQILLSGQPKLDYKLNKPELMNLIQRISIKRYLKNLNEEDTYKYINHRLNIAGYEGPTIFNKNSLKLIWKNSYGVPGKINMLCDNSLVTCYALEKKTVDGNIVREAINRLTYSPFKNKNQDFRNSYFC